MGMLSVSSAAVLITLTHAPAITIAFWRMLFSAALLAPFAFPGQALRTISRNHWLFIFISGIFLSLHFVTWIQSLSRIPIALSTALVSIHPVFIALYERLVQKKSINGLTYLGGMIIFVGIFLPILLPSGEQYDALGIVDAILGAFFAGGYLIIGASVRPHVGISAYAFSVYTVSAIFLGIAQILSYGNFGPLNSQDLWLYVAMAIIPTLGGHTLFNWILRYVPATTVSLSLIGEVAGATLLAWLVLNQVPRPGEAFATLAIGIGLYLTIRHAHHTTATLDIELNDAP